MREGKNRCAMGDGENDDKKASPALSHVFVRVSVAFSVREALRLDLSHTWNGKERRRERGERAQKTGRESESDEREGIGKKQNFTHEIHPDRRYVRLRVGVVGETKQQARLADAGVADEEELREFFFKERSRSMGHEFFVRRRTPSGAL